MANINDLKIGINEVLDTHFSEINIYGEEIKQGFEEPCFFIKVLDSDMNKELGRRYKKSVSFNIHYFSDKEDVNTDCFNMADKLYEVLEDIKVNNLGFRASNMKHEVIDGVLHFMLQFNHFVVKDKDPEIKMNDLEVNVNEK